MPTARLGDRERENLTNAFRTILQRALYNKRFPIKKDDFKEWGYSLLPEKAYKRYEWLKSRYPDLVTDATRWHSSFKISNGSSIYTVGVARSGLPFEYILVPPDHETHDKILTWVEWCYKTDCQVVQASRWISTCIGYCHSIGQVKRILPEEIMRYVPEWMTKTLGHAERRSRIPTGLDLSKEDQEQFANMVALGSLSPKDRKGLSASVDDIVELATTDS